LDCLFDFLREVSGCLFVAAGFSAAGFVVGHADVDDAPAGFVPKSLEMGLRDVSVDNHVEVRAPGLVDLEGTDPEGAWVSVLEFALETPPGA
jgi:hypothetical protein